MLVYYLFRVAAVVVPLIPLGVAYFLADAAAAIASRVARGPRRAVHENMRHVLGAEALPQQVEQAVRGVFRTAARNYVDTFRIPKVLPQELATKTEVINLEAFYQAYQRGKGVVIASCHLGNADMVIQATRTFGVTIIVPVERISPPVLLDFVSALRSSHGILMEPLGPKTARNMLQSLRRGGVVGIMTDRDVQHRGIPVRFFGEDARLSPGAVELALRTGAALVPAFSLRLPNGRYQVTMEPELVLEQRDTLEQTVAHNMARLMRIVETHIVSHPDQWFVFESVWEREANAICSPNSPKSAP